MCHAQQHERSPNTQKSVTVSDIQPGYCIFTLEHISWYACTVEATSKGRLYEGTAAYKGTL